MRSLITKINSIMSFHFIIIWMLALFFISNQILFPQTGNRVHFKGKNLFLNGLNIAWVSFASDLGPNPPDLNQFRREFQTVRDSGGNAMRLWMFTNGSHTPDYNSDGYVSGPGNSIKNLKQILELAHHYNVGLILCLWSFDMLRVTELDSARLNANLYMLKDTAYTNSFIRNALIPMVDSLKGDSAVIAWEVCNEPNGMTTGTSYYPADPTVPVSAIQRFTNLIAGAIHRTDPSALVTTGPGSFQTLTDVNPVSKISELQTINYLSSGLLQKITNEFNTAHRLNLTTGQMKNYLEKVAVIPDSNYYRDDRLKAAGGDSLGILDFYSVHYYSYGLTTYSPFSHQFSYWGLTKPTVVAEFYMTETDGVPDSYLFPVLYQNGYAGALVWSWTDFPNTPNNPNAAEDTWSAMQLMKANYKQDVDPFNTDYPSVSIIDPKNNSLFEDTTEITITAMVIDTGSSITSVKFFSSDSLLGTIDTAFQSNTDTSYFSFNWGSIKNGSYSISALAENNLGQQEISASVSVTFGTLKVTKLEAEKAAVHGSNILTAKDPSASGGAYDDIKSNDTTSTITWQFVNVSSEGDYPVSFGYKLFYDSPKSQFINVNGVRTDTIEFTGSKSSWLEKTITVHLNAGSNTIQMQLWWGWMYLDYLSVPNSIVTSVKNSKQIPASFSLSQNFPNPFNPTTIIRFTIPRSAVVNLTIYNSLGQRLKTLINKELPEGIYNIKFDASDYSSGIYFYTLKTDNFIMTKKMVLLK